MAFRIRGVCPIRCGIWLAVLSPRPSRPPLLCARSAPVFFLIASVRPVWTTTAGGQRSETVERRHEVAVPHSSHRVAPTLSIYSDLLARAVPDDDKHATIGESFRYESALPHRVCRTGRQIVAKSLRHALGAMRVAFFMPVSPCPSGRKTGNGIRGHGRSRLVFYSRQTNHRSKRFVTNGEQQMSEGRLRIGPSKYHYDH